MTNLNSEQENARSSKARYTLVLAGPGTGKTSTLVGRYRFLLENKINPSEILCCSFTTKSTNELKNRMAFETSSNIKDLKIQTFDALALKILKKIGSEIGIPKDFETWTNNFEKMQVIEKLQSEVIEAGSYTDIDTDEISTLKVLEFIDAARRKGLDPEDASIQAVEENDKIAAAHCEVYYAYDRYQMETGKFDFAMIAHLACKALAKNNSSNKKFASQFKHLLVDEFQDINLCQKILIDLFCESGCTFWAVGDDYQAIYGFRGSDVAYILDFQRNFPSAEIFQLRKNYRSGKKILRLAENLSKHFLKSHKKELHATSEKEGSVYHDLVPDDNEETDAILDEITLRINEGTSLSEIAVLSRTNKRLMKVASRLIERGIPVELKGGVTIFEEMEAKQLIYAAAVASNFYLKVKWPRISKDLYSFSKRLNDEGESWQKIVKSISTYLINRPPSDLPDDEIENRKNILESYRETLLQSNNAKSFFPVLEASLSSNSEGEKIFVGTIHSSKGLEWDSVFILGFEEGHLPQMLSLSLRDYEEERRIAYVGITRAKNFLFLTSKYESNNRGSLSTPFIDEMFGPKSYKSAGFKFTPKKEDSNDNPIILERIQSLLRKAKDPASSESEAAEAQKMAERYMETHNVSIKGVSRKDISKSKKDKSEEAYRYRESYTHSNVGDEESEAWVKERWEAYQERVKKQQDTRNREREDSVADGLGGDGTGWNNSLAGSGLLQEIGYTTRKEGPTSRERQKILVDVLMGRVTVPNWLKESVQKQWGNPATNERLQKIRNTLNVALGNQKGRKNPSLQAIAKWESDIDYIDKTLVEMLN